MTLELNIPICLEKMAGNDEKIVVRQQPIFKGKVLILANNDDDKLLSFPYPTYQFTARRISLCHSLLCINVIDHTTASWEATITC